MPGLLEYNSLPWDTGLHVRRAKELLFLQRFVLPHEAVSLGLGSRVVSVESLDGELLRLAAAMARSDPFYLRMAKRMCNSACDYAGQAAHAKSSLSDWTAYRWDWVQKNESRGGLTADHGGKSKTLAPVAQASQAESMYFSNIAEARARAQAQVQAKL
jgi:hypothetical protein